MINRFLNYYKPHKFLFWLDMIVAFFSAILSVFYPALTRSLLKTYIPEKDIQGIIRILVIMVLIIILKLIHHMIKRSNISVANIFIEMIWKIIQKQEIL